MGHDLSFQQLIRFVDFVNVELQTVKSDPLVEVNIVEGKIDSWSKKYAQESERGKPAESLKEKRFIYLLFVLNFHFISFFSRFFRKCRRFKFNFVVAARLMEL